MTKYIVKQKAISALINEANTHSNPVKRAYTRAAALIEQITAEDVQTVRRGRWVQYNRNGEETYIECTNCCVPSRPRHLQMVTRSGEGLPDYCPNCGARMIKDGDTNDRV